MLIMNASMVLVWELYHCRPQKHDHKPRGAGIRGFFSGPIWLLWCTWGATDKGLIGIYRYCIGAMEQLVVSMCGSVCDGLVVGFMRS